MKLGKILQNNFMNLPSKKKIVNAQQNLIKNYLKECLTLEEAIHTCWACLKGLDEPNHNPQRAHIISRTNGGNNEASNFFLLCRDCHKDQPDGNSYEMQLLWLKNQDHIITQSISFSKELVDQFRKEAEKRFKNPEELLEGYTLYIDGKTTKDIMYRASSKSSGLEKSNLRSNINYWFLDHFKTWVKLKILEGKFTDDLAS